MNPPFSLAFVTGATSGIGEALCHLLASKGIALFITGRDQNKLMALADNLGKQVQVKWKVADLAHADQRKALIAELTLTPPDLVINNAGFGLYGDLLTYSTEQQMEILTVNGNAVLELTIETAKLLSLQKKSGTILNVASASAFHYIPSFAVYAAVKAFIVQFSQALDIELAPLGIRVLVSCPGMVATNFTKRASGNKIPFTNLMSLSAAKAADEIWFQIQKGKRCYTFDWKTRWGIYFSYLFPKSWIARFLRGMIIKRIP